MNAPVPLRRREFLRSVAALACLGANGCQCLRNPTAGFQIGCYTRPWDQYEYRVALDGIAQAGFQYAGLMTAKGKSWVIINVDSTSEEVAGIQEQVRQRGLKILSIYGGEFPVAKSVAAGVSGLQRLIDHAAICQCPHLMLGGTADDKLFDAYYQVVAECCDYAAAKGVGLSVKPHGGRNATGPQCRRILEKVGHRNFRLWYDPGNIFYYSDGKLDPVEDAATVNGLVVGMSVKDFKPPKEVAVTPGTGLVRFAEVLARLRKGGFTSGPLIIECLERGDAAAVTAAARKTRLFLESLIGQKA
jgi:sugar phosphate isomerase/epimerase